MSSIKDYITVPISIAALIISGITFYLTRLHDPGVSLEISPRLEWITNNLDQETFMLPITIINRGAKAHVVNQIVLEIENGTAPAIRKYVANKFVVRRATPNEFAPESLTPGSSVARSYMFERFEPGKNTIRAVGKGPVDPNRFALDRAGQYRGTVLLRINGSSDYDAAGEFTFNIAADEVRQLRQKPFETQLILDVKTVR